MSMIQWPYYGVLDERGHLPSSLPFGWRRGVMVSGARSTNEVNARRVRLVLGWVTVFGRVYHFGM